MINNKRCLNLAKEFLLSLKKQESKETSTKLQANQYISSLKSITLNDLTGELDSDDKRKAFWINLYNSFIKLRLQDPLHNKTYPKSKFFEASFIEFDNLSLSFDDIEHKILRKSQIKILGGYLSRCCVPNWEKQLRLKEQDYRIHFGLNCGAKSCPPIAAYNDERIEKQLDLAKRAFINGDSEFTPGDGNKGKLTLSKIFYWFQGDFGGKKGMIKIHREMGIIPDSFTDVSVDYREYDWKVIDGDIKDDE